MPVMATTLPALLVVATSTSSLKKKKKKKKKKKQQQKKKKKSPRKKSPRKTNPKTTNRRLNPFTSDAAASLAAGSGADRLTFQIWEQTTVWHIGTEALRLSFVVSLIKKVFNLFAECATRSKVCLGEGRTS
jgi:hypothetical protein